ncbi:hypothetical protein CIB48_g9538 [Xylaria polymorpha]|nr:hypothetical protein CIB48_g9538 [Xylaria polymorpha]
MTTNRVNLALLLFVVKHESRSVATCIEYGSILLFLISQNPDAGVANRPCRAPSNTTNEQTPTYLPNLEVDNISDILSFHRIRTAGWERRTKANQRHCLHYFLWAADVTISLTQFAGIVTCSVHVGTPYVPESSADP